MTNPSLLFASLLTATIGICSLAWGEPSRADKPDDFNEASLLPKEKSVPLTGLADRCQKMLDKQIALHEGTKLLHQLIEGNADKLPGPRDKVLAVHLAQKQKAHIAEATAIIDMLNAEGVAVAFAEVFEELRAEMKQVQGRLETGDVGLATQALEKHIIDTLKEMLAAVQPAP